MGKKNFLKVLYTTEIARCIWLLVWLVRSLKSSNKEALRKHPLCENYSSISNQIPDIHNAVSVVNDTLKKFFFEHACSYCLILHFSCEIKSGVLLL